MVRFVPNLISEDMVTLPGAETLKNETKKRAKNTSDKKKQTNIFKILGHLFGNSINKSLQTNKKLETLRPINAFLFWREEV